MAKNDVYTNLLQLLKRFHELDIEKQIDYDKFYLYSIITHSTAIEGSTVTEVENQLLFDEGIVPAGKPLVEQLMNLDLRDAYVKWLVWAKGEIHFTSEILCQMSASVMRRTGSVYSTILGDFDSSRGEIRKVNVRAGANGRSYMAFQKVPERLKKFCHWLNESIESTDRTDAAAVYRLSFAAHYRLVTIHPWVDGNGRTTRLLMNILQSHFGVPMSKVMKQDKAEYIQALIDTREVEDESIFIHKMLALHCADIEKQIKEYEEDTNIKNVHVNASNVHVNVRVKLTERQKQLIHLLSVKPTSTIFELATLLNVNEKTIRRDLKYLRNQALVQREGADKNGRWVIKEQ